MSGKRCGNVENPSGKGGKPQDWSEIMKGATPEAVAWSLLQPVNRKPPKDPE